MLETDIIFNINKGDTNAFKHIVEKHEKMVFRVVMGFVHIKEDAEDLTQEIFIQAFQSLKHFEGKSEFATWLYRITVNTSLNYVKKKRIQQLIISAEEKWQNLFNQTEKQYNPEELLIEQELDVHIRKAIDQLTSKQRTAFILSKYNELPQKKIAAIMQISEGAVEQHLQRAKIKLQRKLAGLVGK